MFNFRARAVIDLISTKLQELYNRWEAQGKLSQKKDKRYEKEKRVSDVQPQFSNKIEIRKPRATGFNCSSCGPSKRVSH